MAAPSNTLHFARYHYPDTLTQNHFAPNYFAENRQSLVVSEDLSGLWRVFKIKNAMTRVGKFVSRWCWCLIIAMLASGIFADSASNLLSRMQYYQFADLQSYDGSKLDELGIPVALEHPYLILDTNTVSAALIQQMQQELALDRLTESDRSVWQMPMYYIVGYDQNREPVGLVGVMAFENEISIHQVDTNEGRIGPVVEDHEFYVEGFFRADSLHRLLKSVGRDPMPPRTRKAKNRSSSNMSPGSRNP